MASWHERAFRMTGPLWGESTGYPSKMASNVKLCFLLDINLSRLWKKHWNWRRFETHWCAYDVTVRRWKAHYFKKKLDNKGNCLWLWQHATISILGKKCYTITILTKGVHIFHFAFETFFRVKHSTPSLNLSVWVYNILLYYLPVSGKTLLIERYINQ